MEEILARYVAQGIQTHALRTRQSGSRRFMTMHVLVPGDWTVQAAHTVVERLEADLNAALPALTITAHIEPLDDPASWQDLDLKTAGEGSRSSGGSTLTATSSPAPAPRAARGALCPCAGLLAQLTATLAAN